MKFHVECNVDKIKNAAKVEDLEIKPDNEPLQIHNLSVVDLPCCSTPTGNYDGHIVSNINLK